MGLSLILRPFATHGRGLASLLDAGKDRGMKTDVYRAIVEALERGEPLALATVARTRGSTPRKTGAKMVVRPDGTFFGTIGGGCGEAEVWQAAMDVLRDGRPRIVTVDLTEPTSGEDRICGGVMDVFVERIG